MSLTPYFVLINRRRLESEVTTMITGILAGETGDAIRILKAQMPLLEPTKNVLPSRYYQVKAAIDTLEGRLTEAFVNEITPTIKNPAEAWKHNVNNLVRGGLAASLCVESPSDEFSPSMGFEFLFSGLVRASSPTADRVSDCDDPSLVEPAHTGIFDDEMFLTRPCIGAMLKELEPLVVSLPSLPEDEDTKRGVYQFHALIAATVKKPDLAVLRGYL